MPINRKNGRYYRGIKGKNIKDVGDANDKKKIETNKREKEYGVKIKKWIKYLIDGRSQEEAKDLICKEYGTATDREEEIVLREIEEMKKSIEKEKKEKEKKEKEKKDSKNEGR